MLKRNPPRCRSALVSPWPWPIALDVDRMSMHTTLRALTSLDQPKRFSYSTSECQLLRSTKRCCIMDMATGGRVVTMERLQ